MTAARGRGVGQGRAKQRNRSPNVGRVRASPTVLSAFALPAEETSSRVKVSDVANGPRIATIIRAPIQLVRKESRESSLIKKTCSALMCASTLGGPGPSGAIDSIDDWNGLTTTLVADAWRQ